MDYLDTITAEIRQMRHQTLTVTAVAESEMLATCLQRGFTMADVAPIIEDLAAIRGELANAQ